MSRLARSTRSRGPRPSTAVLATLALTAARAIAASPDVDFDAPRSFRAGANVAMIVVGDFNSDGRDDVATLDSMPGAGTVRVLLGERSGRFSPARAFGSFDGAADQRGAIVAADFDGDGVLDVAVGSPSGGEIITLRGDGAGGFSESNRVAAPWDADPLLAVDADRDGAVDLVSGGVDAGLHVLLGDGLGSFTPVLLVPLGDPATGLASGDWNEDGTPDLAISIRGGVFFERDRLGVYLNDGTGGFAQRLSISMSFGSPTAAATGDFDQDGHADFAVARAGDDRLHLYAGDGTGGFTLVASVDTVHLPTAVLVADLDGDGNDDVAVSGRKLELFRGDGSAGLDSVVVTDGNLGGEGNLAFLDADGDGDLDLAAAGSPAGCSSRIDLHLGDGTLGFRSGRTFDLGRTHPSTLAIADFDGDARLDVAVSNHSDRVLQFAQGDGTGGLSLVDELPLDPGVGMARSADLNGDSNADLILVAPGGFRVLLGDGAGGFVETDASAPFTPLNFIVTDWDEDGALDVTSLSEPGPGAAGVLSFFRGRGDGSLDAPRSVPAGDRPRALATSDVDGDGHLDIGVAKAAGNSNAFLFRGDGSGGFVLAAAIDTPGRLASGIVLLDIDGDGREDLGVREVVGTTGCDWSATVLLGGGGFAFDAPRVEVIGYPPANLVGGDVDGDGLDDLVSASTSEGVFALFSPSGTPVQSTLFGSATSPNELSLADLDADGLLDIVAADDEGFVAVLLNATDGLPEVSCRAGNVGAGAGPTENVLLVNGRRGNGPMRRLIVDREAPFTVRMKVPSSLGAGPARFALYAWTFLPGPDGTVNAPLGAGVLCLSIDRAKKVWNNTGDTAFGDADLPSSPAPSTVLRRDRGVRKRLSFFLQGVIEDSAPPSGVYRVTNGIEIVSR